MGGQATGHISGRTADMDGIVLLEVDRSGLVLATDLDQRTNTIKGSRLVGDPEGKWRVALSQPGK